LNVETWSPSLIPEVYNDPETSGLAAEVKRGEDNVVDISLKSQP
jgi:hypothetical protein